MTKIEALELELKARKMVDGTGLCWDEVLRHKGLRQTPFNLDCYWDVELALGIIEGKPVWDGDDAYWTDMRGSVTKLPVLSGCDLTISGWSWNPPKPKTVMVELLVEDAQWVTYIWMYQSATSPGNISRACRKALEGVK